MSERRRAKAQANNDGGGEERRGRQEGRRVTQPASAASLARLRPRSASGGRTRTAFDADGSDPLSRSLRATARPSSSSGHRPQAAHNDFSAAMSPRRPGVRPAAVAFPAHQRPRSSSAASFTREDLEVQLEIVKRELRERTETINQLQREVDERTLQNNELLAMNPQATANELRRLKKQHASLAVDAQKSKEKVAFLERENGRLRASLGNLEARSNDLGNDIRTLAALRKRRNGGDDGTDETGMWQKLLAVKETQIEDLQNQITTMRAVLSEEKAQAAQLSHDKQALGEDLNRAFAENDKLLDKQVVLQQRLQLLEKTQHHRRTASVSRAQTPSRMASPTPYGAEFGSSSLGDFGVKLADARAENRRLQKKLGESVEAGLQAAANAERFEAVAHDLYQLLALPHPADVADRICTLHQKYIRHGIKMHAHAATQISAILSSSTLLSWDEAKSALIDLQVSCAQADQDRDAVIHSLRQAARATSSVSHGEKAIFLQQLDTLERKATPPEILSVLDDLLKVERSLARTNKRKGDVERRNKQISNGREFRKYKYPSRNAGAIFSERMQDLELFSAAVLNRRKGEMSSQGQHIKRK